MHHNPVPENARASELNPIKTILFIAASPSPETGYTQAEGMTLDTGPNRRGSGLGVKEDYSCGVGSGLVALDEVGYPHGSIISAALQKLTIAFVPHASHGQRDFKHLTVDLRIDVLSEELVYRFVDGNVGIPSDPNVPVNPF